MPEGQVDSDEADGLPEDQDEDDCPKTSDVLRLPTESLPE